MMSSLNGGSYSDAASPSSSASGDSTNYSRNVVTAKTATTAAEEETSSIKHTRRRRKKKQSNKSQHSLDHLRQRVSHLMSIFEEKGWFIPMPDLSNKSSISDDHDDNQQNTKKSSSGKVWSNRNYGADKKRQRKASDRFILESRIRQLETVLKDDHGVMKP